MVWIVFKDLHITRVSYGSVTRITILTVPIHVRYTHS